MDRRKCITSISAGAPSAWPLSGKEESGGVTIEPKKRGQKTLPIFESIDDESGTLARTIRPGHDLPADEDRDGPVPFDG